MTYSARSMFGARIVSVQISEAVFIQQVGSDRKWVNMCAREFIATEWKAMVMCARTIPIRGRIKRKALLRMHVLVG
uniref:AlNc14C182G8242 protein n=1 Tax=Albugo laibachii Nc14 TaxID=890382 RepID=F0WP94_9STRA|nr:AlNc14C182G8242 [Albugo laibachii Nc14]|eukprot:CCA23140.1 AlNc14C182G8242 [Albugo laibachii Nc14]